MEAWGQESSLLARKTPQIMVYNKVDKLEGVVVDASPWVCRAGVAFEWGVYLNHTPQHLEYITLFQA